jgi:hypothetical protein
MGYVKDVATRGAVRIFSPQLRQLRMNRRALDFTYREKLPLPKEWWRSLLTPNATCRCYKKSAALLISLGRCSSIGAGGDK